MDKSVAGGGGSQQPPARQPSHPTTPGGAAEGGAQPPTPPAALHHSPGPDPRQPTPRRGCSSGQLPPGGAPHERDGRGNPAAAMPRRATPSARRGGGVPAGITGKAQALPAALGDQSGTRAAGGWVTRCCGLDAAREDARRRPARLSPQQRRGTAAHRMQCSVGMPFGGRDSIAAQDCELGARYGR